MYGSAFCLFKEHVLFIQESFFLIIGTVIDDSFM